MTLLAYHNDPALKAATIAEMASHREADRLVKGIYWKNGKGCAVGCLLKNDNHAEYERRFGIPQMLARLEDTIFEHLPDTDAMLWPERFLSAPKPGADLSLVGWQFLAFVVEETLSRPEAESIREACQPALEIVRAKATGEEVSESAASAAWSAAASAEASAAWSAVRSAAWSAVASAAASAAWSAEASAARSAMPTSSSS